MISIIKKDKIKYLNENDFLYPDKIYPELKDFINEVSKNNKIFAMVREIFKISKLDEENYGKENWNPLSIYIKPGNNVLIKPNLVLEKNQIDMGEECLYTNPNVVAPIIYYVWKALKGKGKITIADAPVQQCNFEKLINDSGYQKMVDYFKDKKFNIELKDLRGLKTINHVQYENDKSGIVVNLGKNSEHSNLNINEIKKERITNYDPSELSKHHNEKKHEYFIAKEVLDADVIINMPKPKAHRKAGITIGMKNFVGANVRKEYLPHHRLGDKKSGGDEYLKSSLLLIWSSKLKDVSNRLKKKRKVFFAKQISFVSKVFSGLDKRFISKEKNREGSWYGNDTIWRTILDINKIINFCDKRGKMTNKKQRKILNIADMIIVGEKEGPLMPSPRYAGVIVMSDNITCFDKTIATIFGFDFHKIPTLNHLNEVKKYSYNLPDEKIISNYDLWNNKYFYEIKTKHTLLINPSSGWKEHIEL